MVNVAQASRNLISVLSWILCLPACASIDRLNVIQKSSQTSPTQLYETGIPMTQTIDLPKPDLRGKITLEQALFKRRSIREYDQEPLTIDEIAQLLWAAQGVTGDSGRRTAPSAGNLQSLEIYVLTEEGFYQYLPMTHELEQRLNGDLHQSLSAAALDQECVLNAPAVFVIAAVFERLVNKYGVERSARYAHLEAGHAAQNLLLQATALGLAAVPAGAFRDAEVKKVLQLPADQQPLYLVPVGHPK